MMRKKHILLLCFSFFFLSVSLFAQETQEGTSDVLLRKENYGGLTIHTEGWGLNYRWGKHITYDKKRTLEIEFVNIKHPKEYKVNQSFAPESANSFKYGKLNYLYALRFGYGRQKIINHSPAWSGVEVRYTYHVGLVAGITKPVYLEIININTSGSIYFTKVQYDPSIHNLYNIYGKGNYYLGFKHLKVYPGLYAKFGFNFEIDRYRSNVKAIEAGIVADIFPIPVPMMANNPENFYFINLYANINIGKRFN